jgi:ABC-type multidrug transport system fused ATPase/permease subunit
VITLGRVRGRWAKSGIARSAKALDQVDRRKILLVIVLQILLGIVDLIGVAIVGVLGALAVTGVQSGRSGSRVEWALETLNLDGLSFQSQVGVLGALATILLVSRTIFSAFFVRRTYYFLARRGAKISAHLISKVLSQSLVSLNSRTNQETLYGITTGVSTVTTGILGTTVSLVSDGSLLIVMTIGLLIVDPLMAGSTLLTFSFVGILLFKLMHKRARTLGSQNAQLSIKSNEKILEVLSSYRESVVRNRRTYYSQEIGDLRYKLANTEAELSFMPNVSKYVIESTMVLGALLISAAQFATQDAPRAVATLAVFLAAGSRIAPAVLRFQQGALLIRSSLGGASPTLDLIEEMQQIQVLDTNVDQLDLEHKGFSPKLEMSDVSFTYPNGKSAAIDNVSISANVGTSIALVGPSGAGKTTLVDILLGVLNPSNGRTLISGLPPIEAVSRWPGAIAYVPQDIFISNGTIRENVSLGYPSHEATDDLVLEALQVAQLDSFVASLPLGLDTPVGDRGARLSGGQRQRLGIARAMFTKPQLLVLDEATSALDGVTEASISESINVLKGRVTLVLIAHRLSTVLNADKLAYLSEGRVISVGTFDEVRIAVPDFDVQAKLMGL